MKKTKLRRCIICGAKHQRKLDTVPKDVRGHFREFRNEKWKNKQGMKIWILPYIKGKGILIDKIYDGKIETFK